MISPAVNTALLHTNLLFPPSPPFPLTSAMASPAKRYKGPSPVKYDAFMVFWRTVTQIFFREIRPRGAFNIPREGPVIFVGAPHSNQVCHTPIAFATLYSSIQFLDPLLLSLEVYRETHRNVQFLTAAKSMSRKWVGFFARLMDSSMSHRVYW